MATMINEKQTKYDFILSCWEKYNDIEWWQEIPNLSRYRMSSTGKLFAKSGQAIYTWQHSQYGKMAQLITDDNQIKDISIIELYAKLFIPCDLNLESPVLTQASYFSYPPYSMSSARWTESPLLLASRQTELRELKERERVLRKATFLKEEIIRDQENYKKFQKAQWLRSMRLFSLAILDNETGIIYKNSAALQKQLGLTRSAIQAKVKQVNSRYENLEIDDYRLSAIEEILSYIPKVKAGHQDISLFDKIQQAMNTVNKVACEIHHYKITQIDQYQVILKLHIRDKVYDYYLKANKSMLKLSWETIKLNMLLDD